MKTRFILAGFMVVLFNAQAITRPIIIDRNSFVSSPICKKYRCKLIYKDVDNHVYRYNVIDPKTKEMFDTRISTSYKSFGTYKLIKNNIRVDLKPGTLQFMPSVASFAYLRDLFGWYTGIKLDLKKDFWGSLNNVSKDFVDVAPLSTGKIGGIPVTFFIKSVPEYSLITNSIDPKKGWLAYGIVDSSEFPEGVLR